GDADRPSPAQLKMMHEGLLEAFRRTYDGFSLDRIVADPDMNRNLADTCRTLGLPGEPRTWNWTLFGMRKAGLLVDLTAVRRTEFRWEDCENYLFASEIAWRQMIDSGCESIDSILCDPFVALSFDEIARRWAPGYEPLQYRWAALKLRKSAKLVRSRAELLTGARFSREMPLDKNGVRKFPEHPGVYVVATSSDREPLYAGEASNLRQRLQYQFGTTTRPMWKAWESLTARYFSTSCPYTDRRAYQHRLVARHRPKLNLPNQKPA
ncbi:MAG: hypothetical protein HY288_18065, partial [Planctomycetia bacterium]|nr:hypothetical protein [Planctomycetia bacterium]